MSEVCIGSFVVDRFLHSTPDGAVYQAHRPEGEPVWLYTLAVGAGSDDARAAEFARRRSAAAALGQHPRWCRFLETGAERNLAFYAVSAPQGESLSARVERCMLPVESDPGTWSVSAGAGSGRVPAATPRTPELAPCWMIRTWINDLASAASYAHERGIILGNISPYHVWIAPDGCALLTDPGCGSSRPPRKPPGVVDGHPSPRTAGPPSAYLAPEQLLGWPVGPETDIYALGAILFWLLGGSFPYAHRGDTASIGRYLPLPVLPMNADPTLAGVARKATALQPRGRYRTADRLREEILAPSFRREETTREPDRGSRSTLMYGFAREAGPRQPPAAAGQPFRLLKWLQEWL